MCHKPGGLEGQSLKSRCQQGMLSLTALGEAPSGLSQRLVLPAILGVPWLIDASSDLSRHLHMAFF